METIKKKVNSPKGYFRTYELLCAAVAAMVIVYFYGNQTGNDGWLFAQANNIAEAFLGVSILYLSHRVINHVRTHEIIEIKGAGSSASVILAAVWIVSIGFIVGCAFS